MQLLGTEATVVEGWYPDGATLQSNLQRVHGTNAALGNRCNAHLSMPEVISTSLNLENPVGVVAAGDALKRDLAEPTSEPEQHHRY